MGVKRDLALSRQPRTGHFQNSRFPKEIEPLICSDYGYETLVDLETLKPWLIVIEGFPMPQYSKKGENIEQVDKNRGGGGNKRSEQTGEKGEL